MIRVAVSGIPSHWHRTILGSQGTSTIYSGKFAKVATKRELDHQIRIIANTGNYLIGEGVARALAGTHQQFLPFPWLVGPEGDRWVEYINSEFDYFVFGTANIFHPKFNPAAEAAVFKKLTVPILMMSAGVQNASMFGDRYPEVFEPLIDVLREKNCHVFVRGEPTAAFLRKQRVNFVEPTGCPSLYAYPTKVLQSLRRLKQIDWNGDLEIAHAGYLGSVADAIVDVNRLGGGARRASYVLQDECILFDFNIAGQVDDRVYDETNGEIVGPVEYPGQLTSKRELKHHVFFSTEQWRTWIGRFDLAFGRRFHGAVIAAQAGVPFFTLAVDDRTREMLQFAGLPHLEAKVWNVEADKAKLLRETVESLDIEAVIGHYRRLEANFRKLLAEIGVIPRGAAGSQIQEAVLPVPA